MKRLSYAKGLQARTIYWQTFHLRYPGMERIEVERIGDSQSSLRRIIR